MSVIESWLRTFGGLSDKLHQNKLTEMTYDVMLGKISRSATCIAISREVAAATLSTTDIHVCSVFRRLWNNGGNHVTADGRWVVPYTPIGDCSNTEFAAKVAALDRNDATVLDPPTLYRIEQLAGTDETTNFYRKAAKELIAGRNNVRLGKSSLEKIIAALVGVKQCNFRGNDFPAIEFLTTTQVTTYIPLPTGNPTRPASAVPHPTKPGVFCTAKLVATAAVINPAFVEQAMAMHGAATQALDPKLTAAIDGYYQAMGPGNLEYLNKMADRKDFGWPLAVCPNKDKPFVEIMARKPEDSVGITVKDPKWGHKEQDPDLWVPLHAAKADMTASVRPASSPFAPPDCPTPLMAPDPLPPQPTVPRRVLHGREQDGALCARIKPLRQAPEGPLGRGLQPRRPAPQVYSAVAAAVARTGRSRHPARRRCDGQPWLWRQPGADPGQHRL